MGNSMGGAILLAMVGLSGLAVVTAKGWKWKLINFGIILLAIAAGFGLGAAAGAWGESMAIGGMIAVPLAEWFAIAAALGCWRRNKMREKTALLATAQQTEIKPEARNL